MLYVKKYLLIVFSLLAIPVWTLLWFLTSLGTGLGGCSNDVIFNAHKTNCIGGHVFSIAAAIFAVAGFVFVVGIFIKGLKSKIWVIADLIYLILTIALVVLFKYQELIK